MGKTTPSRMRWGRLGSMAVAASIAAGCHSPPCPSHPQYASAASSEGLRKKDLSGSNSGASTGDPPEYGGVRAAQHESQATIVSAVQMPHANGLGLTRSFPIDLPTALRLGNANNLEIALAREQINAALARLEGAEVLWLPSLTAGSTYLRHDGQIQRSTGEVLDVRRSSLFVGGGPVAFVDLADAIYEPLVAARVLRAEQAAADVATNDSLLRIAEAYFDLLAAQANLAIAEETRDHAATLAKVTEEFANQGAGLPSDAARAQTELGSREQQIVAAKETLVTASTELARLLRLDPLAQLTPIEPSVVPIELVPDGRPLADLVAHALSNRPELAEQQALVQASIERLRQARYGPLLPSVLLGYAAGGFGGGPGDFFGNFDGREDFTAAAVWELRNLGFGDRAQRRLRTSQLNQTQLLALQIADRVAAEVVAAEQVVESRREQVDIMKRTVESALRSFELNEIRIRRGAGLPIEALQAIQALDHARINYLNAVVSYNKAQFRLLTALGNTPVAPQENTETHAEQESNTNLPVVP